jgi:uncharacterized protein (TIGR00369 family)
MAAEVRPGSRDDPARSRTVTWEDPLLGARLGTSMSGLDYLRAIQNGDVPAPPIVLLLDMSIEEVEPGRAVFELVPAEYHFNPIGMVHGGVLTTLLDSAMGCAVHAMLPAGSAYTTLELKVNFLRRVTTETGRLRCEGSVIHLGRTVATAEGRIVDGDGRLVAHATTTCLVALPDPGTADQGRQPGRTSPDS